MFFDSPGVVDVARVALVALMAFSTVSRSPWRLKMVSSSFLTLDGASKTVRSTVSFMGSFANDCSYVLLQMTARPSGDPIEREALTKTFRTC